MGKELTFEREKELIHALKQTIGMNGEGKPVFWADLILMDDAFADCDIDTLRYDGTMLSAGGFFLDFEDTGDSFAIRSGNLSQLQYRGLVRMPLHRVPLPWMILGVVLSTVLLVLWRLFC